MKATELRIGNFVHYKSMISWVKLDIEDFRQLEYDIENKLIAPIKLTEEWLLKFNIKKDEDFGNWNLDKYEIYSIDTDEYTTFICGIIDNEVYWYNYACDDFYSSTIKMKYVHQLQNLYFALTGKELIKK